MADGAFKPNLYVVARFLDALAEPEATHTASTLQRAVGVNYDVFRRYVDLLEARHLVERRPGGTAGSPIVVATAEGRRVRTELRVMLARFLGAAGNPANDEPTRAGSRTNAASDAP